MRHFGAALVLATGLLSPISGAIADDTAAKNAFNTLSSLVGDWKRKDAPESKLTVRFQLTAGGSTIMETWLNGDKPHSLTVYHRDQDTMLATHYCPQGNQPRMKLKTDGDADTIKFKFMDATNLPSREQSHQHSLGFQIQNSGKTLVRKEAYLSKAGLDSSDLILERVEP